MATVVAFHAHPDDEVLLTGGTLARLAAEGHRTVVVVACCGGLGADPETRLAELRVSAARLGVARVVHLGYADSGHGPVLYPDPPGQVRFARADPDEAAGKLANISGRPKLVYPRKKFSFRDLVESRLGLAGIGPLLPALSGVRTPLYLMQ